MALTITAANSEYLLSIPGVFGAPVALEGFGVDEAFDTQDADIAEVQLGVDGLSVGGWVPRLTIQTITLLAASPSFFVFEDWQRAMDTAREVMYAAGTIRIPSINRVYSLPQGTLTRVPQIPHVRRVLQQRSFTITWSWPVTSAPIG